MTFSTWETLTRLRDAMAGWLAVVAGVIAFVALAAPERWRKWVVGAFLLLIFAIGYLAATGG